MNALLTSKINGLNLNYRERYEKLFPYGPLIEQEFQKNIQDKEWLDILNFAPTNIKELKNIDRLELQRDIWSVAEDKAEYIEEHSSDSTPEEILMESTPFLPKGVIKYPAAKGMTQYFYWETRGENLCFFMIVNSFSDSSGILIVPFELLGFGEFEWFIEDGEVQLSGFSLDPCEIANESISKMKNKPDGIDAYIKRRTDFANKLLNESYIAYVMNIFRYVNIMFTEHNEAVEAEVNGEKEKPEKKLKVTRGSKKNGQKRKIILKEIVIREGENTNIKVKSGKIMQRHTQAWGVRGHIRHLRNGKSIWIAPYEKGPKRNQGLADSKVYVIPSEKE